MFKVAFGLDTCIKTISPLINALINDALLDSRPFFNQTLLHLINIFHWLLISTFLHHFPYLVVNRIGVRTGGRPQVWFDKIRGFVSQQLIGFTRTVCWLARCPAGKCKNRWQCDGWLAANCLDSKALR